MISYDDFAKIELKVAKVMEAERVSNSEKLIRLQLDLGEKNEANLPAGRQVIAGIGKTYAPEDLIGKEIVIVANLEPRSLMGLESNGMLLAASDEDGPVLLVPDLEVVPGSGIK